MGSKEKIRDFFFSDAFNWKERDLFHSVFEFFYSDHYTYMRKLYIQYDRINRALLDYDFMWEQP